MKFWHIWAIGLFLTGCSKGVEESDNGTLPPPNTAEVCIEVPGLLTASPSETGKSATRADGEFIPDSETLVGKPLLPLEEGATLWLLIDGTKDVETNPGEGTAYHTLKSYVVRGRDAGQYLYPCTVDENGNVINESGTQLFIPFGSYTFRALSPARAFRDEQGNAILDPNDVDVYRQLVSNGDYMISNDERYTQTAGKAIDIKPSDQKVQLVKLNPLINQTAQLKFTISTEKSIELEVLPAGVEISGLQSVYGREDKDGNIRLWNWSPNIQDTLIAYPGRKDAQITLHMGNPQISYPDSHTVVIEAAILPTDATSSPLFIVLNMAVNDTPTQYQMTLNQKIFRSAYSYHYKGTISINDGITVLTWQNVSWDTEVEIDPIE